MGTCRVTFYPANKTIVVPKGTDILQAAVAAGVYIHSSCGGEGVCGRCKVIVKEGTVISEPSGRLSKEERQKGYVLACRTTVHSDTIVEVPPSSGLAKEQILTEEAKETRLVGLFSEAAEIERGVVEERAIFSHSPLATKLFLRLPPPSLEDNVSDLERLYREIRRRQKIVYLQTGLANVKKMGRLFRESNWQVTVTLGKRNGTTEVVLIEPGDTSDRNFGIALDIGTTTVVAQLVNLNTHEVLGIKATHNRQASYGEDVISRMIYAKKSADGLERLHHAVVDTINELISALITEHKVSLSEVMAISCAGNMTMIHLLLKVDPTPIRREPYVPTANFMPVIRAAEAGIKINPRGLLATVPGVSGYVGGDITAGVLASGIDRAEQISMLIDIGTNGEIVLGNKDWLVCCSSSAGPAFEGSGVRCGVRAMQGAIQRVEIDPQTYEVHYSTIGDAKPIGICGSGYIDVTAELFKAKIINRSGKIRSDVQTDRIREGTDGLEFVLVWADQSGIGEDILVTQADLTNLIHSKGAIYTAARVLANKMGLELEDVEKIYIAGGFGNYLNIKKSIWIGLLPDLPQERFEFIGNSSLSGARLTLLSYDAMMKARDIARRMTYIELSTEPAFMNEYTGALFLPHTDIASFPTAVRDLTLK